LPPHGRFQGRRNPSLPSPFLPPLLVATAGVSCRVKPGRCQQRMTSLNPAQAPPRWGWWAGGGARWRLFLGGGGLGFDGPDLGPASPIWAWHGSVVHFVGPWSWLRWISADQEGSGGDGLRAASQQRGLHGPNLGPAGPAGPSVSLMWRLVGTRRRWYRTSFWCVLPVFLVYL
jgi:hypothetical protein